MKKNQKIFTALIISCILCFLVGIAGVFSAQNVNAENSFSSIALKEGASVRMADSYDETGLRYQLTMSAKDYQDIKTLDKDVTFGILIAPLTYHQENALNQQNVFGIGGEAKYDWAEKGAEYTGSKTRIINLSTKELGFNDMDNTYNFFGSIVKIKEQNKDKVFVGVGYALYTEGGQQKAIMVTDESNQRSMAYVAQKEIEALNEKIAIEQDEAEKALMQADVTSLTTSYVTGVKSTATAKYYKLAKNGVYEEVIGDRHETAEAQQIGNDFTAPEKDYEDEGYVLNTAISNTEGIIYANGKTELKSYYYQPNLGLVDNKTVTKFDYKTALPNANSYTLNKVIWDNEEHPDQNANFDETLTGNHAPREGFITERKVAMTLNSDKLDLTNLDGVYEIVANYGNDDVKAIKFDVYDATSNEYVWNTVENAIDYTRLYSYAMNYTYDIEGRIVETTLAEDGHSGKYLKLNYNAYNETYDKTATAQIGGFSILSIHSYDYYKALASDIFNTYSLKFSFKVEGKTTEDATIGLKANTVYRNGVEINSDNDLINADAELAPNTWYDVKIPLTTLLTNWDVMRNKSNDATTNSPNYAGNLAKLVFWVDQTRIDGVYFGTLVKDFNLWVGDISLQSEAVCDLNNLFSKSEDYHFQRLFRLETTEADTYNKYLCIDALNSQPMTAVADGQEYNGKTKNFVFEKPTMANWGINALAVKAPSYMTKDFFKALKELGYTKLTYSIVMHAEAAEDIAFTGAINFDYLKANPTKRVFNGLDVTGVTNDLINKSYNLGAFSQEVATVKSNEWLTIEYSLDDLIACYDQVFGGDYFVLGLPFVREKNVSGNHMYISPIQIVK